MKRSTLGRALALPAAAALALGVAACGSANEQSSGGDSGLSGQLAGAGASSQEAAQQAWQAKFIGKNSGATVNYDPVGSGGGREQFIEGGTDFAGSDAYLDDEELAAAKKRCGGGLVEVPVYVSPIALVFNVEGVDSLNLKPGTIAQIFDGKITKWNDPAIKADNPDANLPAENITPVHRSDESGTTENFVDYLSKAAPEDWKHEVDGNWPNKGGEAAQGTSGIIQTVGQAKGSIGYADASRAGDLSTVKVGVGNEFVEYTPEAAAKVLEVSERHHANEKNVLAYDLARDTSEGGTYPIVLVSYGLACTNYDDANKAKLVKSYLDFVVSPEGQKAAADAAGSAPLSDALSKQAKAAVDAISTEASKG